MYESEKLILPEFPRTAHLPIEPNAGDDDIIASDFSLSNFLQKTIYVEEKIDATNLGIAVVNGNPIVRNRTHILRKGCSKCKTPSQIQYQRVWTWLYSNLELWDKLNKLLGYTASVYGEWMYATHVCHYNKLPDLFIAFDVYNSEDKKFLLPAIARKMLLKAGFNVTPLLSVGKYTTGELINIRDGESKFSTLSPREGVYLKSEDGTERYKMVSPWFKSDDDWNKKALIKNIIEK